VTLPVGVASSSCPLLLGLELWHGSTLLGGNGMLLVPASLATVAAELQELPWGTEEEADVADYISDLGHWLSCNHASSPACSRAGAGAEQQGSSCNPWEAGVALLRQTVLWGLPAVSTLLVDSLVALPFAPANPFTHLAHAPASSGAAPGLSVPEEVNLPMSDIGGLLHLSLLCPNSRHMLATVLDWGKRWGSKEAGFAWRWEEESAAGISPLDILATLPGESKVLRLLLRDAEQSNELLGAALQQ